MTLYAGVDLHSNNNYVGIVNEANVVMFRKKLSNDLGKVLAVLEPYRHDIEGIAVESTFNWYWFVDGPMDNGYTVHLANPAAIQQYKGLKRIDDERSALWLANLLRLGILPAGYIYPKEERSHPGSSPEKASARKTPYIPYLKHQEHHEPESWDPDEKQ